MISLDQCSLCGGDINTQLCSELNCGHVFHESCIAEHERKSSTRQCPRCYSMNYTRKPTLMIRGHGAFSPYSNINDEQIVLSS